MSGHGKALTLPAPVAFDLDAALARIRPKPPALMWGIGWRTFLLEVATLTMSGNVIPGRMPAAALPLLIVALGCSGVVGRLHGRWQATGAAWRVLMAAGVIAETSAWAASRFFLVSLLAGLALCLVEPMAQRARRSVRIRRRRDVDRQPVLAPEPRRQPWCT